MKRFLCMLCCFCVLLAIPAYAAPLSHTHHFVPCDAYDMQWDADAISHTKHHVRLFACSCGQTYWGGVRVAIPSAPHEFASCSAVNAMDADCWQWTCSVCCYTRHIPQTAYDAFAPAHHN